MAETATRPILVTPTTHERLTEIKDANDLASFDRLIMRALDAFEANNRETPEPPQNAPTSPATSE